MPPKKLNKNAQRAIKDIFQAQTYQDWVSKWPGVDILSFVRRYQNSLDFFHRTHDVYTDLPPRMVGNGKAAEYRWLTQRGKLTTGFFVNVVDHEPGAHYGVAFLERANQAAFTNLMAKKVKPDGKPPTVKDLADWKWVDDHTAFADVEEVVHAGLLRALVAHLLGAANNAREKGGLALQKVIQLEAKEADAVKRRPVVECEAESKVKSVTEAKESMDRCTVILGEVEKFWKVEKVE